MLGIVNPLDVPVPQKVSDDVSVLIPRPAICHLGKKFDGTFGDVVTGTQLQTAIAGTRYGVVNGVVTSFGPNIPAVEDNGLRVCPAFTQSAKMTEALPDAAWVKTNLLTPLYLTKTFIKIFTNVKILKDILGEYGNRIQKRRYFYPSSVGFLAG